LQSDADIAAVARVIRQTYGARAASLMESRSKDYERAGAWGRAEFWGKVALMVRDFDLAENPTVGREPMDPAESKRSP
jgi:hypothetical protein